MTERSVLANAQGVVQGIVQGFARRGKAPWLAGLWLVLVIGVVAHQIGFWRDARLDTDVMAMLPGSARTALADRALQQLSDGASRQVVVLIGASDWQKARAAAARWSAVTAPARALLEPDDKLAAFDFGAALSFYGPHRAGLLTDAQRAQLRDADAGTLARQALAGLYQFAAGPQLLQWQADPLSLWTGWWQARAATTRVGERDGLAFVSAEGKQWAVLTYRATRPAFSAAGATEYRALLQSAGTAARGDDGDDGSAGVTVIAAGIPLHAEAAAAQASTEMNVIGLGSLAAVLLLVWLAFRSVRPIVLIALSLAIGTAAAISVTALVFERVHLITLVFGASLVGVAEDYGIHYFVTRQARPGWRPGRIMTLLLPGLLLALATSVAAYMVLGVAPFPGLRQMALFSATGLVCAFLTVALWFPLLDRGTLRTTPLSRWLTGSLSRWPRLRPDWRSASGLVVLALFIAGGIWRVDIRDDVRQLQSSPPALIESQRAVGRLLQAPSPAQFILVRGATPEQVLQREEAVKTALAPQIAAGALAGVIAVSDWIPSLARQQADAALVLPMEREVRTRVRQLIGEPERATLQDAVLPPPLHFEAWLAARASAPLRHLWLGKADDGFASAILVRGMDKLEAMPGIAGAVDGVAGAQWVDRVADYTGLLAKYRTMMSWLLLGGAVLIGLLLVSRYRRQAWRALVPTLLAAALSVAVLGWLSVPLQLFSVLALALLLGVGVDYGIFLLEHPGDGASWTAIALGALSTLLAFGLLALSATPALHAFGLTMLSGVGAVWALSPLFRPLGPGTHAASH